MTPRLCLLVSRRCDLRCSFCPVEFPGGDMSWEVARRSVDLFVEKWGAGRAPGARVKFFGGEPLLNFPVLRRVVEEGRRRWRGHGLRFELATNGSFLDAPAAAYFRSRPEVEVTVSHFRPRAPVLEESWFTLVLERGAGPRDTLARLRRLLRAGYRRFNFLPVYYLSWTAPQLHGLRRSLAAAARLIEGLWDKGIGVRVRNLEVASPFALYNDALAVDADGTVYASNMIQCKGMERYRERLRLGSVLDAARPLPADRPGPRELRAILAQWAGASAWRSTERVDRELTAFVRRLA